MATGNATEGPNERKGLKAVDLGDKRPQIARQLELPFPRAGEACCAERSEEASLARNKRTAPGMSDLMERAVEGDNLQAALKRVRKNKGVPGIDGMTVKELGSHLRDNWPQIREQLLSGTYQPQAVVQKLIPKDGGKTRMLGIPTVLDRLIQQVLLQVLQPIYDPTFSDHSHGFRPGRSAHDAIREAREHVREGKTWVVDVDLSSFFDRVSHDILMGRLARRIADRRVLGLIRRYLKAGMLAEGVVIQRDKGTPQGGPLSPLLANVLLDEVDQELEKRGHAFVRYADDSRVFLRSRRAGERVMRLLRRLYGRLKLVINEEKSAVAPFSERPFLGYDLYTAWNGELALAPSKKSLRRFKAMVRRETRRPIGRSVARVIQWLAPRIRGWWNYFQLTTCQGTLRRVGGWLRRRLRALQLSQWKNCRTIARKLRALGASERQVRWVTAFTGRWWYAAGRPSHSTLTNRFFDELGLPRLVPPPQSLEPPCT